MDGEPLFFRGDPEANPGMPIARLTSKPHARELRETIDLFRRTPSELERFSRVGQSVRPGSCSTTRWALAPASPEETALEAAAPHRRLIAESECSWAGGGSPRRDRRHAD